MTQSSQETPQREKEGARLLGQEALMSLLRTAFLVRRRFDNLMQAHGVTGQQYNVLRILRGAGEPLPTMEVSARMVEPEPGITRLVRRLERKGLVSRTPGTDDARQKLCAVTDEGLRVLSALDAPIGAANADMTRRLDPEQLRTLIDVLAEIQASATPRAD